MKKKMKKMLLKKEYMFESIIIKNKKDGINRVAYYNKIFSPLLYPFYE